MSKHQNAGPGAGVVPELTSVHDALSRAVGTESNRVRLLPASYKVNPVKKEIAEQICAKSGTTLPAFLRECIDGLIGDFMGPKAAADLDAESLT